MSNKPPIKFSPAPNSQVVCPYCQLLVNVDPTQAGFVMACPSCGGQFQIPIPTAHAPTGHFQNPYPRPYGYQSFVDKKIAAGICGILFGGLGVHKFILGFNGAGTIMLVFWLIGLITGMCIVIPILATVAMNIIGLIEGIIYLTKSDDEFYQAYAIQRKEWF